MTLKIIENEIIRFLQSEEPEVLSIKGNWGIGKTFTFEKILEENKTKLALGKYAYVSLFGINDVDSLKASIFKETRDKENIGSEFDFNTLPQHILSTLSSPKNLKKTQWRKGVVNGVNLLKKFPIVSKYVSFVDPSLFFSVSHTIICIDDFERKGDDLDVKDVLGVISLLKEKRRCKIILIFNEDKLKDCNNKYKELREKVVDIEVLFDITAQEAVEIVFEDKNNVFFQEICEHAKTLGINNIRILKKIVRLFNILCDKLQRYEDSVLNKAIHSLVLYSWCFYSRNEEVPSLEFLEKNAHITTYTSGQKAVNESEVKWKSILREYNYSHADAFDLAILEGVKSGYFNENLLLKEAENLNNQFKNQKSRENVGNIFNSLYESFENNEAEIIEALKNSFYTNYTVLTPLDLDAIVGLCRKIGQDEFANECISFYIEKRKGEKELFVLKTNPMNSQIEDKWLLECFEAIEKKFIEVLPIRDLLLKIYRNKSWNQEDSKRLESVSEKEFFSLFKAENGADLRRIIETSLSFKLIAAKEALNKIGKENRLNKLRVLRYGIDAQDDESNK